MKHWILTGALLLTTALFAETPAPADPALLCEINDNFEIALPKARLLSFENIGFERSVGYRFNGRNSYIMLEEKGPKKTLTTKLSIACTAAVSELPPKGQEPSPIFFRPGYHNYLGVDYRGLVAFNIWTKTPDGKNISNHLYSKRTVRVGEGRFFRAAVTLEPVGENSYKVKLYMDGALENEKVITGKIFDHNNTFYLGGARPSIQNVPPLNGVIRACRVYSRVLSDEEILSLL